jgi:hypothetical protein
LADATPALCFKLRDNFAAVHDVFIHTAVSSQCIPRIENPAGGRSPGSFEV